MKENNCAIVIDSAVFGQGLGPVVWVELSTFQETRKYVQRVLANYLVYRARLGLGEMTPAQALRRIPG